MKHNCEECEGTFHSKQSLKLHVTTQHLGLRPHKCELCDKTFTQIGHLSTHMKLKHLERKFPCTKCDKIFGLKGHLDEHFAWRHRNGEGARKFNCNECSFTTLYRASFAGHKKTHQAEKNFRCDQCNAAFNLKDTLKRHVLDKHIYLGKMNCEVCFKTFTTSRS